MQSNKPRQTPALFAPIGENDAYFEKMMDDVHHRVVCEPYQTSSVSLASEQVGSDFAAYKAFLNSEVFPSVINVASKRYIGHMTGPVPPFLYHIQQDMVRMNQNQVKIETSGIGTAIEREVLTYFHRLTFKEAAGFYAQYAHDTETALGVFTSGGTLSNVTALQYALAKAASDDDVCLNDAGLQLALQNKGYSKVVVFASALFHYSIKKAAKLMGIGKNAVIPFQWDASEEEKSAEALKQAIQKEQASGALVLALVGVAGTTESGAIDCLPKLAEIAKFTGVHFHVDAAYGGAFLLSSSAYKLTGIEQADTVTICGHKQLYIPIGCSMVLFRSAEFASFSENNTNYQARKGSLDLGKFTLEGTRPFCALLLHAAIRMHGRSGYSEVLDGNVWLANQFYELLAKAPEVNLYAKPELNIILYRFVPNWLRDALEQNTLTESQVDELNHLNERLQQKQFKDGRFFVSFTKVFDSKIGRDMVWLRAVFMNPFTQIEDMSALVSDQQRIMYSMLQGTR